MNKIFFKTVVFVSWLIGWLFALLFFVPYVFFAMVTNLVFLPDFADFWFGLKEDVKEYRERLKYFLFGVWDA